MLFVTSSIKEVKPASADHMMVKHSMPEMIFQACQQGTLGQEQEVGFAFKPKRSQGRASPPHLMETLEW